LAMSGSGVRIGMAPTPPQSRGIRQGQAPPSTGFSGAAPGAPTTSGSAARPTAPAARPPSGATTWGFVWRGLRSSLYPFFSSLYPIAQWLIPYRQIRPYRFLRHLQLRHPFHPPPDRAAIRPPLCWLRTCSSGSYLVLASSHEMCGMDWVVGLRAL
jgi:hypothetical protein